MSQEPETDQLYLDSAMADDEFEEVQVEPKIVLKDSTKKSAFSVDDQQIYALYQTLDIDFDEINKKFGVWRLNVVHIRGVQEMSSDDVLAYFNDYDPSSIEWVNDLSCNVVFEDEKAAATAIIGLTNALVLKNAKDLDIDLSIEVVDADSLEVPIPPGRWRLGRHNDKSKALLLRFANNSDKKIRGSRKLSNYYAKYGAPEMTNIRQSLNQSTLDKPFEKRKRKAFEQDRDVDQDEEDLVISSKKLRMRMRADDEEEKVDVRKRITDQRLGLIVEEAEDDQLELEIEFETGHKKSIWERLDNDEFGNYCGIDPDLATISKTDQSTKTSVWTRLKGNKPKRNLMSQVSKNFTTNSFMRNSKSSVGDLRNRISRRKRT